MKYLDMRGMKVPVLGLGTWEINGSACQHAIASALDIGYRHIDTEQVYGNETEIGKALADSGLRGDEFFVTTKVWIENVTAQRVRSSVEESLQKLRLEYVNLLLLHWPVENVSLEETLDAMTKLQNQGKTRAIGVSNFPVALMREAIEDHGFEIACNQVEYHVQLSQ
jgi:2,5-diketo-D-gluconate reductase B